LSLNISRLNQYNCRLIGDTTKNIVDAMQNTIDDFFLTIHGANERVKVKEMYRDMINLFILSLHCILYLCEFEFRLRSY